MAKRGQIFVEVDSDEDSINTTTTAESDGGGEYAVEKILLEDVNEDTGEKWYLMKWEGYPLGEASWEPIGNLAEASKSVLLRSWNKEKLAIKQGTAKPFPIDDYNIAFEQLQDEKDNKRRRRIAKRLKRGEIVEFPEQGQHSEDEADSAMPSSASKRTRVQAPLIRRKGVAVPVKKNRSKVFLASDEDDISASGNESSSSDEPISARREQQAKKTTTIPKPQKSKPQPAVPTPISGQIANKPKPKPSPQDNDSVSTHSHPKEVQASLPKPPPLTTTAARKSAPTTASATAPAKPALASKVFGGDWTADKKKSRQHSRVSGETPKDSADPKFSHLSIQNRYHKYGQNEPAPDVNALTMIDPRTGRVEPPKIAQSPRRPSETVKTGPSEMHSAYGRRSPPKNSRTKSLSPQRPITDNLPPTNCEHVHIQVNTDIEASKVPVQTPSSAVRAPSGPLQRTVCLYWKAGNCKFTADTCRFAHSDGPGVVLPKQGVTCYYWKTRGWCKNSDDQCEFAHYDTGTYAGKPGTFDGPAVVLPKKDVTCYYWKTRGRCGKSDDQCEFAHYDTGNYAGQPGTFNGRDSSISKVAAINTSDPHLAGASSPNESRMFLHAPEQPPQQPPTLAKESEDVFRRIVVGDSPVVTSAVNKTVTSPQVQAPSTNIKFSSEGVSDLTDKGSFVDTVTISPAKDPRLRSRIVTPIEALIEAPTMDEPVYINRSPEADLEMAKKYINTLDSIRLLKESREKGGQIDNVYIHMPPNRPGELKLLRQYFTNFNCKVYYWPHEMGFDHWKYFSDIFQKSCLLVFHPSENFIETTPGLHRYLRNYGNSVRVFSIGVQHNQCILDEREPAYEARRLFPHGGITFITDDVFFYYPEKATEIIETFMEIEEPKPPGARLSKIGARPGVKDWMARLVMKKFEEDGGEGKSTDIRYVKCYDALCRLCPTEDEDLDYPDHSVPLDSSYLWSVWEESLPSFKGRWESGDEEGATDYMANHFAGEACEKAWQYRKFFFVYQRPGMEKETTNSQGAMEVKHEVDPKGWGEKYCHIGVMTPDQVLRFMKPPKK